MALIDTSNAINATLFAAALFATPLAVAGDYQVMTRCASMTHFNAGITRCHSRSAHVFTDDGEYLDLAFPHFYVTGSPMQETAPGAPCDIKAWVEYPYGTYMPVLFSGSANGVLPDGGIGPADRLLFPRKAGHIAFVHADRSCPAGLPFTGKAALFMGEKANLGAGIGNYVPGQAIGGSDANNCYFPIWATGLTTMRSMAICGDSVDYGSSDAVQGDRGALGFIARSIDPHMGYTRLAVPSDRAAWFLASSTQRRRAVEKCTDVSIGYGTNDLAGGRTKAELEADMAGIVALLPSRMPKYTRQLIPRTASTDNWATSANQSVATGVASGFEATLAAINSARDTLGQGFAACWPTFDVLSDKTIASGAKANKWGSDPAAIGHWLTSDGTHPNMRGNMRVRDDRIVRPVN